MHYYWLICEGFSTKDGHDRNCGRGQNITILPKRGQKGPILYKGAKSVPSKISPRSFEFLFNFKIKIKICKFFAHFLKLGVSVLLCFKVHTMKVSNPFLKIWYHTHLNQSRKSGHSIWSKYGAHEKSFRFWHCSIALLFGRFGQSQKKFLLNLIQCVEVKGATEGGVT